MNRSWLVTSHLRHSASPSLSGQSVSRFLPTPRSDAYSLQCLRRVGAPGLQRDFHCRERAQGDEDIATPIHAAPHALRTRWADSSRRFGDTGWAVPSSCANSETLYSSTIHRNSLSNCRPSSVAGGFAWN